MGSKMNKICRLAIIAGRAVIIGALLTPVAEAEKLYVNGITNLYLFGQMTTPSAKELVSEKWIRPADATSEIEVSTLDFMSSQMFAVGAQFEIVKKFFETDKNSLTAGSYSKSEVKEILGSGSKSTWDIPESYKMLMGSSTDKANVYIYGDKMQSFAIADGAKFVVDAQGNRSIENFAVVPAFKNGKPINFDLSDKEAVKNIIDPSRIGRKVTINFTADVPTKTYNKNSYFIEMLSLSIFNNIPKKTAINLEAINSRDLNMQVKALFSAGVTKFADTAGRTVIYGTHKDDNIDVHEVIEKMYPDSYNKNKSVTVIAGGGGDVITNIPYRSVIYGGAGADTYSNALKSGGVEITIADPSPEDRVSLLQEMDGKNVSNSINGSADKRPGDSYPMWTLPKTDDDSDKFVVTYTENGNATNATVLDMNGLQLRLPNFKDGDMGINLKGGVPKTRNR